MAANVGDPKSFPGGEIDIVTSRERQWDGRFID